MIIVGDACTDDTAEVVRSFGDNRLRYYNLKNNFGDQSGPNNIGFSVASGQYIAYLNHDDLYFADHLASSLDLLEQTGADFVHSSALRCFPVQESGSQLKMRMTLHSFSDSARYNPIATVPASTWICRRDLIDRIGGWKPATKVYESSSQEWLYRVWKSGAKMIYKSLPGVIIVPSSLRGTDYTDRHFEDQAYYAERIVNPSYRETELAKIASSLAGSRLLARLSPVYHLKTFGGFCYRLLARVFMRIGIPMSPRGLNRLFTFGRRGNFIQNLRRRRGLSAIDAKTQDNYVFEFQESPDSLNIQNT